MANNISINDPNNSLSIHDSIDGLTLSVKGKNNVIEIGECLRPSVIRITINGDYNRIKISSILNVKELIINVGTHVPANRTSLEIGRNISMERFNYILLHNSGNRCVIGDDCMFSNEVTIRGGESPHLLFDRNTGEYIDISDGIFIGNHVWIGEKVFIMKNVTIPNECIVGAGSVVTKRFDKEYCVIAGNPARVVRENVQWVKNYGHLEKNSKFYQSYYNHINKFK